MQKILKETVSRSFYDRAYEYRRGLGNSGATPDREIIRIGNPMLYGMNRAVLNVNPDQWQEKVQRRYYDQLNHVRGQYPDLLGVGQVMTDPGLMRPANNPRIYFEQDGPRQIMGLLKEFLELQFQFETPLEFKHHLYLSPCLFQRPMSEEEFQNILQREIQNVIHRIERQQCPRFEAELRNTRMRWGGINGPDLLANLNLDAILPQREEMTLYRGELNSKLNINQLNISVNPGPLNSEVPPVQVAGVNIQENLSTDLTGELTLTHIPGTSYQITPSYTCSSLTGVGYMAASNVVLTVNGQTLANATGDWTYSINNPITIGAPMYDIGIPVGNIATSGTTITFSGYATSATGYFAPNSYVTANDNGTWTISGGGIIKADPIQAVKNFIKSNLSNTRRRRSVLVENVPANELKARDTLRDMISESDWRRYVTNGFIMVKAQSGKWYQVFNDLRRLCVYEKGVKIEEICIHSEGVPPTDHVINMKVMIEFDEDAVRKGGNISRVAPLTGNPAARNNIPGAIQYNLDGTIKGSLTPPAAKNLIDLFKSTKVA